MNILKQRQHKGIYTLACGLLMLLTCSTASAQKYVGGDISMLPRYEQAGATYYTHERTEHLRPRSPTASRWA
jgi:hypothetical protein